MEPQDLNYKGHRIALVVARELQRDQEREPELRIDDVQVAYGRLPDGHFVLSDYAYDPADDLISLAKRRIDYMDTANRIRRAD